MCTNFILLLFYFISFTELKYTALTHVKKRGQTLEALAAHLYLDVP